MTWFKIDDKLHAHPKWWALTPDAKALWTTAGAWSASYKTDGLIRDAELAILSPQVGLSPLKIKKAAAELVEARMWVVVDGTGFQFHQWTEFNPPRATLEKEAAIEKERNKIKNDSDLKAAVRARDGDLCRYCGIEVNFAARTGHTAGRYDHVLPVTKGGKTTVGNVVVACDFDNRKKYNKTLEEAGMTLLDPGTRAPAAELRPRKNLAAAKSQNRGGLGSGPGTGLVENGSKTGLVDAGLVDHGPGQDGNVLPAPPVPEHELVEGAA